METNDLDQFSEDSLNCDTFDSDNVCLKKQSTKRYRPTPKRLLPLVHPIDFEKYVKINCQERIKILNRAKFHQIEKPIIIFFNHFRDKCAYHTKCLDKFFQLALKYGELIEFIAGDMLDIDVMNSKWHSIDLFCRIGNPEKGSALIYALDEQKRIYEYVGGEKATESLTSLCDNLIGGTLFITQPLPETNQTLIKICVHQNFKQVVTDSIKHILLIVGLYDYIEACNKDELNYEAVAEQLKGFDVDVVYINAEKNYIPFEFEILNYPSLLLIPRDEKNQYIKPINGPYTQENLIKCIEFYLKDPKLYLDTKQSELRKNSYQPLNISPDTNIRLCDLQQYLQENCQHYLKMFDRQAFQRTNRFIIIAFLNFQNERCSAHHLKWIDRIYQVAANLSSPREYFIADFKDIDVINPVWQPQDFRKHTQSVHMAPKVFGLDLNKNKFILKDFQNAGSLFYFAYSLTNGELYISEPWPNVNDEKLVKTCIADSLNLSITSVKKNIFLVIYYSKTENNTEFLQLLEEIAQDLIELELKVLKIDSRLNCIPLELDDSMYPIMYFIPQIDKSRRIRFNSEYFYKEEIVQFIKQNIKESKENKNCLM